MNSTIQIFPFEKAYTSNIIYDGRVASSFILSPFQQRAGVAIVLLM